MMELLVAGTCWGTTNYFLGDTATADTENKQEVESRPISNLLLFRQPSVAVAYAINQVSEGLESGIEGVR